MKIFWIGIDAHKMYCTISVLNSKGVLTIQREVETYEKELKLAIKKIQGIRNIVIEESTIANWLYLTLKPYANDIIICDPKENKSIHSSENKSDKVDSEKLASLYRMGYVKPVYHTELAEFTTLHKLIGHYNKYSSIYSYR